MKWISTLRPALRRLAFLLCVWLLAGWAVPAARAQAPVFTQAYMVGQPASGSTYTLSKMVVDPAGNVYLTGYFQGSVLLGSTILTSAAPYPGGNSYAYPDLFVAKLDPAGAVLWAVQAGGPGDDRGYGISLDTLGHVFVTGMAQGTARFGLLNLNNNPLESPQVVVARLDAGSGAWQWLAQGGGNRTNRGAGIVADQAGHVFVAGETGDSGRGVYFDGLLTIRGNDDVFVAQLDAATGAWQWVELAGGATTTCKTNALVMDQAGNLYVSGGYRSGTLQFGTLPALPVAGQEDVFVAKLAVATRTWLWATVGGGPENDNSTTLAVDAAGHVVIGGVFKSASLSLGATTLSSQPKVTV